jgi:hypothetical protein
MSKDTYPDQSLIKQDIEEIVGRVVGEIVGAALQLIADQFKTQSKELKAEIRGVRKTAMRADNKINSSIDIVTEFNDRLKQLRTKTA